MKRKIYSKGVWQMTALGMDFLEKESVSFEYEGPVAEAISIMFAASYGVPGDISRPTAPYNSETQAFNPAVGTPFGNYGLPGQMVGGFFVPITATGNPIYGFLIRPYPSMGPSASDPIGVAVPPTAGPASVLKKGYVTVVCQVGSPAQGGAVNIRFQNAAAGKVIGGVEATASADTYVATGWTFTGNADANGNCEITNI